MRIISGTWKGKTLIVPDEGTRPSTDRTREALFNILQHIIEGATVLDLFSGSGALALEALSRGANIATAVENDKFACREIKKNVSSLNAKNLNIVQSDVISFLELSQYNKFSLIFADPPYEKTFRDSQLHRSLSHPNLSSIVSEDAIFVAESPEKLRPKDLKEVPKHWELLSQRKYGKCHLTLFQFRTD